MTDIARITAFMTRHARLLDRRRFELLFQSGSADAVRAALAPYRSDDGGYGSGLEPDLRSPGSQPVSALHAFEVFEEIAPVTAPEATLLCDWLASITLPDGGVPFAFPTGDPAGCAPFFVTADPSESSLHMTSMLAAVAHRIGWHDPAVRSHEWLAAATEYAMRHIRAMEAAGHALEYRYVLQFLDATHDAVPGAASELRRIGAFLPDSGSMPVQGGIDGEAMGPLDFSPEPGRPIRDLFPAATIEAGLDRLMAEQRDDGGWTVDWAAHSPAGALEWRGWATVRALKILLAHGLPPSD